MHAIMARPTEMFQFKTSFCATKNFAKGTHFDEAMLETLDNALRVFSLKLDCWSKLNHRHIRRAARARYEPSQIRRQQHINEDNISTQL